MPAWAKTEKQQEQENEADVDKLLDFITELDFEKYLEDFEVRQALSIIKTRVRELAHSGELS